MRQKRRWSEAELKTLKNYYPTHPRKAILESLPQRSWMSIKIRARRLGLQRDHRRFNPAQTPLTTKAISQFDLGYLVGIIEGEGTISIRSKKAWGGPYISIVNSDIELLNKCKLLMGGNLFPSPGRANENPAWKKTYRLETGRLIDVRNALSVLIPVLYGRKKEVAKLVFDYCETRLSIGFHKPRSKEELELFDKIRALNKRGKNAVGG